MLAVLIGCSVAAARGFFALARDRRLPSVLGKVSGRGTPLLVLYLVVIVLTAAWTSLFAQGELPHYVAMFSWGSTYGSFALVVTAAAIFGSVYKVQAATIYAAIGTLALGLVLAYVFPGRPSFTLVGKVEERNPV